MRKRKIVLVGTLDDLAKIVDDSQIEGAVIRKAWLKDFLER